MTVSRGQIARKSAASGTDLSYNARGTIVPAFFISWIRAFVVILKINDTKNVNSPPSLAQEPPNLKKRHWIDCLFFFKTPLRLYLVSRKRIDRPVLNKFRKIEINYSLILNCICLPILYYVVIFKGLANNKFKCSFRDNDPKMFASLNVICKQVHVFLFSSSSSFSSNNWLDSKLAT